VLDPEFHIAELDREILVLMDKVDELLGYESAETASASPKTSALLKRSKSKVNVVADSDVLDASPYDQLHEIQYFGALGERKKEKPRAFVGTDMLDVNVFPCEKLLELGIGLNLDEVCAICRNTWDAFPPSSFACVLDCSHTICLQDLCENLKASELVSPWTL
jgi:hypothetical protein